MRNGWKSYGGWVGAGLFAIGLLISRMETCRSKSEASLLVQERNVARLEKIEEYIKNHKEEVKAGMEKLERVALEQASRTQTVRSTDARFEAIEARLANLERAVLSQRSKLGSGEGSKPSMGSSP